MVIKEGYMTITDAIKKFYDDNGKIHIQDIKNGRELKFHNDLNTFPETKDISGRLGKIGDIVVVASSKQDVIMALSLGFTKSGGVRYIPFNKDGNISKSYYYSSYTARTFLFSKD